MGTFHVTIEVGDLQGNLWETIAALVDTSASHTVVPASLLRRLGVTPHDRWPFRLADERIVERDVGQAWIRIDGRAAIRIVVFGEEGAEPLLGAESLEGLRLGVDPVGRRLIQVPGLLMAQAFPIPLPAAVDCKPDQPATAPVARG